MIYYSILPFIESLEKVKVIVLLLTSPNSFSVMLNLSYRYYSIYFFVAKVIFLSLSDYRDKYWLRNIASACS